MKITKKDVEATRQILKELKDETRKLQDEVDELVHREQQEKQKLVKVSSNFAEYSEDKIRESYEAVKDVQPGWEPDLFNTFLGRNKAKK